MNFGIRKDKGFFAIVQMVDFGKNDFLFVFLKTRAFFFFGIFAVLGIVCLRLPATAFFLWHISAIVTLVNARKTKSALGVAYALIAFALSLYSMFALQVTMFDTFSQGAKDLYRYGLFGYFATATILIIATIGLLSAIRKKKSIANGKEATPQQKPE